MCNVHSDSLKSKLKQSSKQYWATGDRRQAVGSRSRAGERSTWAGHHSCEGGGLRAHRSIPNATGSARPAVRPLARPLAAHQRPPCRTHDRPPQMTEPHARTTGQQTPPRSKHLHRAPELWQGTGNRNRYTTAPQQICDRDADQPLRTRALTIAYHFITTSSMWYLVHDFLNVKYY